MITGFVLISTAARVEHEVYAELLKVKSIKELNPLFGEFDMIAKVEVEDLDTLGKVVTEQICTVKGVIDTRTLTGPKF